MFELCIKGGTVATDARVFKGDVYVQEGRVAAIVEGGAPLPTKETVDAAGRLVFPGFIDSHAHLNDPGLTESEDFYTGTCSAAAGGITTVLEHPLTVPLPVNRAILQDKEALCKAKAVTDFGQFGASVPQSLPNLAEMAGYGVVAFKAFMPYSPEIPQSTDTELLDAMAALSGTGIPLVIHCENDNILATLTRRQIEAGRTTPADYEAAHTEINEVEAVGRVALFALHTGAKVHVAHCSSAAAVDVAAEYRAKGADITVETCSHFLSLDSRDVEKWGVYAICNPPLRSPEHVEQLWQRVLEGKVNLIGSDHATYTFEEKEAGLENVFQTPAGLTAIQTCFPVVFSEGVKKRNLPLEQFVALTSTNTAKRFGLYPRKGTLAPGSDADITIIDPGQSWTIAKDDLLYKMKWTPLMGRTLQGRVVHTIVRGRTVYKDGAILAKAGYGQFQRPVRG